MADTHGFRVVLEAGPSVLKKALRGAWKSAACMTDPGDTGRIPEYVDIPAGTGVGPYVLADGQAQIPEAQLDAKLDPAINGAELKLGLKLQMEVADPPVPSAGLFDMTADVFARVPIGVLPGEKNVRMLLGGLPRANVRAVLTSGDPLKPKLPTLLGEYVHAAYENGSPGVTPDPAFPSIPHSQGQLDVAMAVPFGSVTVDTYTEIYDDAANAAHRIQVSLPDDHTVEITVPIYVRIFHIRRAGAASYFTLLDPMGIETRLIIRAGLESPAGSYRARLDTATVTTGPIVPAPGIEGTNYTANKAAIPVVSLDDMLSAEIEAQGTALVHGWGTATVVVPTVADIETAIADEFHTQLEQRGFISLWTPDSPGSPLDVDDVTTKVFDDFLAIALNAGEGADIAALADFIPDDREFAIALNGAMVQQMIDDSRSDNGFADSDLPKRFTQDGHDVDINSLDVGAVDGAIRLTGEVTVIDAILDSIDVDADFRVDIGLHWEPNAALDASGGQMLRHHVIDDDVDPEDSVAFWVIAVILAVVSFGAGGALVAVVVIIVALIVQAIAGNIGSSLLVDGVSGAINGITAWPPDLARIGRVRAVFHNPVTIESSGLVLAGTLEVISSCETVEVLAADSGGEYTAQAASPLTLEAQHTSGAASYDWVAGDGSLLVVSQDLTHVYAASGRYVAKHRLRINQPGGALSRHFAFVDVRNVPPSVDAGPDIVVYEGEVVTLVGHFEDVEPGDSHESSWTFGDDQPPQPGVIDETNDPPKAVGTSTVQHAWCDNGDFEVRLRVRDHNGGVGMDTRRVRVLNVPPTVDAGVDLFAYPCTVITLRGAFEDPGWCDTHTATWDFGDCTPAQMATITEEHEPPKGVGVATASHVYHCCGTYLAMCTVIDDDGGIGQDTMVVRVTDIANAHFEDGFRDRRLGRVANEWEPYLAPVIPHAAPTTSLASRSIGGGVGEFLIADEFVVRDGQRAQGIRLLGQIAAGVWQAVGANVGWDYQVVAYCSVSEASGGAARLGVDAGGGTDPTAASVVWTERTEDQVWGNVAVRARATGTAITIFLEGRPGDGRNGGTIHFDRVALVPVQPDCPEVAPMPERPVEQEACVDFSDEKPGTELPAEFEKQGFRFHAIGHGSITIQAPDSPDGSPTLVIHFGLFIELPFPASEVDVWILHRGGSPLVLAAVNGDGVEVDRVDVVAGAEGQEPVTLRGQDIVMVRIAGRGAEASLIRICARRDTVLDMTETPLDKARIVLARERHSILDAYKAVGVGIGKAEGGDSYAITVYLPTADTLPPAPVAIDGVPLQFEVTGALRAQLE